MPKADQNAVSIVVCAYTRERLELTVAACEAARRQLRPSDELVVVVDHNSELEALLAERLPGTVLVSNTGQPGLSDARNSGIAATTRPIIVFLDDDAQPSTNWLENMVAPFSDPSVAVVGGHAIAEWQGGRPPWFPPEFLWVVGCSYVGQDIGENVRNPLGCSMAIRRSVFDAIGGFDRDMGRVGRIPLGCEETELCLRYRARHPESRVVVTSASVVRHRVSMPRRRIGYFVRRCFFEGVSKAVLQGMSTAQPLRMEQRYAVRVLPRAFMRGLAQGVFGPDRVISVSRSGSIALGLSCTVLGYGVARLGMMDGRRALNPSQPPSNMAGRPG